MAEKINDIKIEFENASMEDYEELFEKYADDSRAGVLNLIKKYRKEIEKLEAEKKRSYSLMEYERKYSEYQYICGIDEAGRGPLAGPVVAGAVILPKNCDILYINDSKQLSEKKREELFEIINEKAVAVGVGMATPKRIDEINILNATYEAMKQAIDNLSVTPDILLNDAVRIPGVNQPQVPIIKGDAKSLSIGAASIIAKVTRDRMMKEYARIYPEYGFETNKGYGAAVHIGAIKKFGPCPIHRSSFIKNFVE